MEFASSSSPFGQTSSYTSTLFGTPVECSSVFATNISSPFGRSNSSSFGGFQATTISPSSGNRFRGSAVESFSATPEIDKNGRNIQSISAMPVYESKSHEELRLEDYELKQNRKDAVQESKSYFGAPKSKTYVSPPFGGPCAEFESIGGSSNGVSGALTPTIFGAPNTSVICRTNSMFGVSNAAPFSPLCSSSNCIFGGPTPFTSQAPTTPSLWSTSASQNTSAFGVQSSSGGISSSCLKTCDNQAKLFQSTGKSPFHPTSQPFAANNSTNCFSSCNLFSSEAPTTPPLWSTLFSSFSAFGSTSASENTSAFGIQSFCGGQTPLSSPFCFNTSTANSPFDNPANLFRNRSTANSQPFQWPPLFQNASQPEGQQYVPPSSTVGMQSANPFGKRYEIDGPNAVITIEHGTSSIQVSGKISSLTILPVRGVDSGGSSEPCFMTSQRTFHGTTISGGSPSNARLGSQYRATPEIDANITGKIESISAIPICNDKSCEELRSEGNELPGGEGCEANACPSASFKVSVTETEVSDDDFVQDQEEDDDTAIKKREADVLALMPKLPDGDYYTEPCIKDLAAKEMAEPGFCSRVNDFVVGIKGYGSIKFLGETDIRHLDIGSAIQIENEELIVYPDDRKEQPLGQSLNKPSEVTLPNVN